MKKDLYDKLPNNDDIQRVIREGLEAYKVDITGDKSPDFRTRFMYLQEVLELRGYKNGYGLRNAFEVMRDERQNSLQKLIIQKHNGEIIETLPELEEVVGV